MTPEQFRALVSSKRSADRRLAARALGETPAIADKADIEAAYHNETVPHIRRQFAAALKALSNLPAIETGAQEAREIFDEANLKAVRVVTERILHQLNPLIGDIEQAASEEVP